LGTGGTNREVRYLYENNRVSRSYIQTGGYDFRFGYDGQGRLESVTHNEALEGVVDYRYFYDKASNVTRRYNYYNGSEVNYVYDHADRITDVDLKRLVNNVGETLISHEHYTLDNMNRVTAILHQQGGTTTDNFTYDDAGQLKNATYGWANPLGNCTYNWDNAGNRLSAGGKNYTPNAYNQYTAVTGDTITNGSEHEIASYKAMAYKYYGDTYLSSVTGGGNTYQLYYDALGRCVERKLIVGTTLTTNYYLYDGEHWIQEYKSDGTSYTGAVYGLGVDEILGRGVNGVAHWPLPDRNGNTAVVTSSMTGAGSTLTTTILEQYRYDAFGAPTFKNAAGTNLATQASAIGNRFLFTGREYNSQFGFYEYRARAYHPGLGRFMSEDPKGFDAGDYNFYRYCGNDPWDLTDPMGLEFDVSQNSDDNIVRWNTAVSAWKQNSAAAAVYNAVQASSVIVRVVIKSFDNNNYSDGSLHVDLTHGGELQQGGYNSPATRAIHEVTHTADRIANPEK
jgi:RHS repeat-associated protein